MPTNANQALIAYPFSAVVGQQAYKLALILAAINPAIGGVLVSGPRGSAKSTLARALADILPGNQHPFVNLPLGASEEMLTGTLDLQKVMVDKEVAFQPGLLAKAHNGVLYVDEVNLLPDNLVDLLLDVAASGENTVERDGISHQHAARFLLLGTMNPDEGELRPQLQDRFGLAVNLSQPYTLEERVDIVAAREAFDAAPQNFCERYAETQQQLQQKIAQARQLLTKVSCAETLRYCIAERCQKAQVDGVRADVVWLRAALAHAAYRGAEEVAQQDVDAVEELVLCHRRRADSDNHHHQQSDKAPSNDGQPNSHNQSPPFKRPQPNQQKNSLQEEGVSKNEDQASASADVDWGVMPAQHQMIEDEFVDADYLEACFEENVRARVSFVGEQKLMPLAARRRAGSTLNRSTGKVLPQVKTHVLDWFSTLLLNRGSWPLKQWQHKPARRNAALVHLIMLDTSASTLQGRAQAKAKATILAIARKAYWRREQLVVLGFGNQSVDLLQPLVRAPKQLQQWLDQLQAGGGTPLVEVLVKAENLQQQLLRKQPGLNFRNYLITDGRSRQFSASASLNGQTLLVDIEQAAVKRGRGAEIAQALNARYCLLPA